MHFNREFISLGCSPTFSAIKLSFDGSLGIYNGGSTVGLFSPATRTLLDVIPSSFPISIVKAIDFVHNGCIPIGIIIGTCNGTISLWSLSLQKSISKVFEYMTSHKSIEALQVCTIVASGIEKTILVTSGLDHYVKLWQLDSTLTLLGEFTLGPFHYIKCFAYSASELKEPQSTSESLLACASTDKSILIYDISDPRQLILIQSLKGHENWVSSLDFYRHSQTLLLASGSLDKSIRLWKFHHESSSKRSKCNRLASLEALLLSHDNWVTSVQWIQGLPEATLASSSTDGYCFLWKNEHSQWSTVLGIGDLNDTFGYFTLVGHQNILIANSHSGTLHFWNLQGSPLGCMTGHTSSIEDLAFSENFPVVFTVSKDQTTRIFSPIPTTLDSKSISGIWHEIGRPQIHGYDMTCIVVSNLNIISGADEKVIRYFTPPKSFLSILLQLNPQHSKLSEKLQLCSIDHVQVSSLGLTSTPSTLPLVDPNPNAENYLDKNSLWCELDKAYGHPFELFTLAVKGDMIASACKSNHPDSSAIRLWRISSDKLIPLSVSLGISSNEQSQQIEHVQHTLPITHTLTVTRMVFHPHRHILASASRDRSLALFTFTPTESIQLVSFKFYPKAHSRIIWDLCWSESGNELVTVSRDSAVKFWSLRDDTLHFIESVDLSDAVTAIAMVSDFVYIVGCESGSLWILERHEKCLVKPLGYGHTGSVKRICVNRDKRLIATCSADHSLFIFTF